MRGGFYYEIVPSHEAFRRLGTMRTVGLVSGSIPGTGQIIIRSALVVLLPRCFVVSKGQSVCRSPSEFS